MDKLTKAFPLELKSLTDTGEFDGYASTYDKDSYGDVIMPGAFRRTILAHEAKGRPVPVLWQHDHTRPIGVTLQLREDERGLYVKGQLLTEELQLAREARALAKAGALGGLSIGFSIPKGGAEFDSDEDVRRIREVRLWEYSLVTFPANEHATLSGVKSLEHELAEVKDALRTLTDTIRHPSDGAGGEDAPDPSGVLKEARELLAALRK